MTYTPTAILRLAVWMRCSSMRSWPSEGCAAIPDWSTRIPTSASAITSAFWRRGRRRSATASMEFCARRCATGVSRRYFPALLQAAVITLILSCAAMTLAIVLGVLIATGRVYGPRPLQGLLTAYVEVIRGTPLLLQLFVLYFGLAPIVQLPAFVAALVGLGLNYAAYESEIYRSALQAVPRGQLDAARALGLTDR